MSRWMIEERGVKHIALMSRRTLVELEKASNPQQNEWLRLKRTTKEYNAHVNVVQADVTNFQQVHDLIERFQKTCYPIRGIIHGAVVAEDRTLNNLTQEHLSLVLPPKVRGAWYLHQATQLLHAPLHFFIMFSSIRNHLLEVASAGYNAGNQFLDALAYYRFTKLNLPVLSISLPAVSGTEMFHHQKEMLSTLRVTQGFELLPTITVFKLIECFHQTQKICPSISYLRKIVNQISSSSSSSEKTHSIESSAANWLGQETGIYIPLSALLQGLSIETIATLVYNKLTEKEQTKSSAAKEQDSGFDLINENEVQFSNTSTYSGLENLIIIGFCISNTYFLLIYYTKMFPQKKQTVATTGQKAQRLIVSGRTEAIASSAQQRIYMHENLSFSASDYSVYNYVIPLTIKRGSVFIEHIRLSLVSVIQQHTVFRTAIRFNSMHNEIEQNILPFTENIYSFQHSQGVSTLEKLDRLLTNESIGKYFDVENGKVLRCHVVQRSADNYDDSLHEDDLIIFVIHHIAFDLSSYKPFLKAFERACLANEYQQSLLTMPQYVDFALYEQALLSDTNPESKMNKARRFWANLMHGYDWDKIRYLVRDENRTDQHYSGRGYTTAFTINQDLVDAMMLFASTNNVTMFSLYLACYYAFLFKLTNHSNDMCVVSSIANRSEKEIQDMIGMFVNLVLYRVKTEPNNTFEHLVKQVQPLSKEILMHSSLPYQQIIESQGKRENNALPSAFFQYEPLKLAVTQKNSIELTLSEGSVISGYYDRDLNHQSGISLFDISLTIIHDHHTPSTECFLDCSADIFKHQDDVDLLSKRFQHILTQLFCSSIAGGSTYNQCSIFISNLSLNLPEEIEEIQKVIFHRLPTTANKAPASYAQARIWHDERIRFDPDKPPIAIYNMPFVYRLQPGYTLSIKQLRHALHLTVDKHLSLHTSLHFDIEKNLLIQRVITHEDKSNNLFSVIETTYETDEQLNEILHDEKRNPHLFDLAQGLVFRCHLVYCKQISSNDLLSHKDLLIFNFHHALFDFSSMNIFLHDLNQAYTTDQLLYDDSTNLRYLDYAVIEQQMPMTGAGMFWLDTLHDCKLDQPLSLPFDRYRLSNEHRTSRATSISFDFGQDLSHDFLTHASSNNISLEHLAFAIYFIFLFKLTNRQTDLCIAMNINNNRFRDELKSIIGLFENVIPLPCQLDPHWFFHQLLEHVRETITNSMKYSYFPLQHILNQHPHISEHTFLDTHLEFISYKTNNNNNAIMIGDSQLVPGSFSFHTNEDEILGASDFSLSFHHDMNMNQLSCTINASLDLFNRGTVETISQRFHSILHQSSAFIIDNQINKSIYELSLTLSNEQYLMQSLNNTQVSFPSAPTCIHHEFVQQVMKHPQKLAVELDEQSLTYCELLYYVQVLSLTLLNEYHVLPGEIVCQCVERSLSMVIGIMGIEMAGGVYCPLSPRDPEYRLHALTQQTQSRLVLVHHLTKTKFNHDIAIPDIDSILTNTETHSRIHVNRLSDVAVIPDSMAYIIFTSGSTGIPKPTQLRHRNFTRSIQSLVHVDIFNKNDIIVQMARCSFDLHVQEILGTLIIGTTVIMLHPQGNYDFEYLSILMEKKQITFLYTVPTLLQLFFKFIKETKKAYVIQYLRSLCTGGERCSVQLVELLESIINSDCSIWNLCGPAETTLQSLFHRVNSQIDAVTIPLGRPLPNYSCIIEDDFGQCLIVGKEGEILVRGIGIFAGYLGRDDLTARALVEIDGELFYRTGDLVTMDNNGLLRYQGRKDHQIKLHGQRIELGEIERCLLNITSISAGVVMKWKDDHLVAYVQSSDIDENALREHCQLHLPPHMIPSIFIILDKLPMNANGKIDRKLLPPLNFSSILISDNEAQYIEPNDIVEMKIHLIWCEILQRTHISMNTSFFSIGGHSLLLMKLYHRYKVVFNLGTNTMNVTQLIEHVTIAEHASLIKHWSDYVQQDVKPWYLLNFTSDDSIIHGFSSSSKGRLYIRHKNIDDLSQDETMIIEQLEKSYLSAVIQEIYIMWITDPRFNENIELKQRLAAIVVSQAHELTVLEELEKFSNRKHFHNVQIPWAVLTEKESHSTLLKGMNREILEKHYRTKIINILLANVTFDTSLNITEQERFPQSDTLIEHDKLLDPSLQPSIETNNKEKCKDIFLTGSTGFLGSYLLDELLKQTDANIYCLVRSKRITDTLQSRVIYLYGDLTLPQLGLHNYQYSMLVSKICSIYHCGAEVNFIKSYTDLRSANVLSTLELIKLACLTNCRINYISTLSVLDENNQSGYVQSKQVAECLVKQASERDLTVSILRPGKTTPSTII
ncbi:unnamed protein product [Adineta steineri]|uniref:Carrier domain-containing protein n=1 Tax=Adineta steineri TaxID=433720 RepID=A0A815IXN9_9BILA|nr:unnamed protein product [Adineta steineri]CAF1374810.1 unnamed protein product [Adineta steineri]